MRKRLPDFVSSMPVTKIELGSSDTLPAGYEAGHALGFTYGPGDLPSEKQLASDLKRAIESYRALVFRTNETEEDTEAMTEFELPSNTSVIETRKYVYHRKIERNATAAKNAKIPWSDLWLAMSIWKSVTGCSAKATSRRITSSPFRP